MIYADYSQAELRIAADITKDMFMRAAVSKPGSDFHTEVAKAIYGPNFTKEQRNWYCKRAVFGWLYGGNVYEIARDALRFPEVEARRFADEWNANFKGAVKWRDEIAQEMYMNGEIVTAFGRHRRFWVITRDNKIEAMHAAQNAPMQASASDCTLTAMMLLHKKYKDDPRVYVMTTVHDSCLVACKDEPDLVKQVSDDVTAYMLYVASRFFPSVPHQADTKIGDRWGTLKGE
jgi:DNA polymerase-1